MSTTQVSPPEGADVAFPAHVAPSMKHVPELDGLRGVAVLLVLIGHGVKPILAVTGVALFFVLSGFLITRILLHSVHKNHFFTNFYTRRSFRIWPLYYLILAIAFLPPLFGWSHPIPHAWRYLLYIQNFWGEAHVPILGPTWSLAIEEQFYLVWPFVVWQCKQSRRVGALALVLIAVTPIVRVLYHLHGIDPYALTFGRLDGLATGAALASLSFLSFTRQGKALLFGVLAAISVAILPLLHHVLLRKAFKDTSTNLMFMALVGFAFYWSRTGATAVLRTWLLRFFGTISYCAYLVHLPLYYRFGFPVGFVLTVVIATASFYLFERPILLLKDRFTRVDPVV